MNTSANGRTRVVVAGGGFAGVWAVRRLARNKNLDIILVDRNNYHTFLPLLYQVAAAELEPGQIAYPLRAIFRKHRNVRFVMSDVRQVDAENKVLKTDGPDIPFDKLIIAMGSFTAFYGVQGADKNCFRLKNLEQAITLRNHIVSCFEQATHEPDSDRKDRILTYTVVGGGPTGVEYAGALAELIRQPLTKDFPTLNTGQARVVLLEAGDGLLAGFPDHLRSYAFERLTKMGVDVRLNAKVTGVTKTSVELEDCSPLRTETVVWTAGVQGHGQAASMGLPTGRGGRVPVLPTLQLEDDPDIYVAGDMALPQGDSPAPLIAPNATQQGALAAENILASLKGKPLRAFRYRDKGSMATIGRAAAVVRLKEGKTATGFVAWVLWLFVHLMYLVGFRNRLFVMFTWAWDYIFFERAARIIIPREAIEDEDAP
ncbi:NAD(P)/FAD-dependent oxidoreductase [Oleidesulfovibrio sp.]|uniref:NAD(P)/FAD-dependent oxidoreductase n=1 Tax=Oleidesulfovibrio sp. TaxID=2909707 RepID=UPI003A8AFC7F